MENALSKTAAIREAQSACGKIHRRSSTDYVFYAPYYDNKLDGPSTELQADSYPKCVAVRSRKVARIALSLMRPEMTEYEDIDVEFAFEQAQRYGSASARELVDAGIDALSNAATT